MFESIFDDGRCAGMHWLEYGVLFVVAAVSTIALTPLCKKLAWRLGAVDYPSARRVNKKPIPRLGGVAIFLSVFIAITVFVVGSQLLQGVNPLDEALDDEVNYVLVFLGVMFMFAVGVVDDATQLRARYKLLGQVIAACLVASSGLLLSSIHNPFAGGYFEFGWFSYPLTVFYLVAFANVINLIDGLDGLAAGISAISAITIFAFAVITSRYDAALFSIAIAGACIGFLRYNFNPASIFMGDSGALFLGFTLGVASLLSIARSAFLMSVMVPVLAAGIPVIDTAAAIFRRMRAHKPISEPDKGHIHHRLIESGFSQRKTVLIMWGWTAILALSGIVITETTGLVRIVSALAVCAVTLYVIIRFRLLEPVLRHHYHPRARKRDDGSDEESIAQ